MSKESKKIKSSMSLKAFIKNEAAKNKIPAQLVMQNYMLERLLERISVSSYKENIILKGGFLISTIVGLNMRTTMDLDTTIKGLPLTKELVSDIFFDICKIDVKDSINFEIKKIVDIRENDEYAGARIFLEALYPPLEVQLSIDVTTGDKITPKEIDYSFKMMFEDRYINVLAYNLETILAEKLETVVSRGKANTRARDYYDIYVFYSLFKNKIKFETLSRALKATYAKRESLQIFEIYKNRMEEVEKDTEINKIWNNYQKDFEYSKDIKFKEICDTVILMLDKTR